MEGYESFCMRGSQDGFNLIRKTIKKSDLDALIVTGMIDQELYLGLNINT